MNARKSKLKYKCSLINFYRTRADFEKPGLDPDVVDLRYKHCQGRLIDTFNRIVE